MSKDNAKSNLDMELERQRAEAEGKSAAEYARGLIDGQKQKAAEFMSVLGITA
jgi:hypothetical protein